MSDFNDREKEVIRLHQEGKTQREIAKMRHMSLRDVGNIINRFKEHEQEKMRASKAGEGITSTRGSNSKAVVEYKEDPMVARAYKMFEENLDLPSVTIKLRMDPEIVKGWYRSYLEDKALGNLVILQREIGNMGVDSLIGLHNEMKRYQLLPNTFALKLKKIADMDSAIIQKQGDLADLEVEIEDGKKKSEENNAEYEAAFRAVGQGQRILKETQNELEGWQQKVKDVKAELDILSQKKEVIELYISNIIKENENKVDKKALGMERMIALKKIADLDKFIQLSVQATLDAMNQAPYRGKIISYWNRNSQNNQQNAQALFNDEIDAVSVIAKEILHKKFKKMLDEITKDTFLEPQKDPGNYLKDTPMRTKSEI